MTVNANYTGNIRKPFCQTLTGTSKTTIGPVVDAGDRTNTLASWSFVNPTGAPVNCELYWNDGTTDYLVWRKAVAANSTEVESNLPIRLDGGNSIKVVGANTVTITLIYSLAYQVS
ncbi:hypothetical protein [Agrobacterium tumefaciens]|uniref:hypothetical protein n=1 Tax=Agrobacterium tumefaciens TaxID=358 RepID=UPI001658DFD2|nr:hypothetical protein [Agrobacterium tumefaciens]QNP80983.1 hypothetical protein IAI05_07025 [Agrobacterium tumefaciens]